MPLIEHSRPAGRARSTLWLVPVLTLLAGCAMTSGASPRAAINPDTYGMAVAHAAGAGLDEGFSFGTAAQSGPMTLAATSFFYIACSHGEFAVGTLRSRCDGDAHRLGPYGRPGAIVMISAPRGHWAIIIRPSSPHRPVPPSPPAG